MQVQTLSHKISLCNYPVMFSLTSNKHHQSFNKSFEKKKLHHTWTNFDIQNKLISSIFLQHIKSHIFFIILLCLVIQIISQFQITDDNKQCLIPCLLFPSIYVLSFCPFYLLSVPLVCLYLLNSSLPHPLYPFLVLLAQNPPCVAGQLQVTPHYATNK